MEDAMSESIGRKIVGVVEREQPVVDQFGTKHVVVERRTLDDGTVVRSFPIVTEDGTQMFAVLGVHKPDNRKRPIVRVTDKVVDTRGFRLDSYKAPYETYCHPSL
jgi:hypothetical protein